MHKFVQTIYLHYFCRLMTDRIKYLLLKEVCFSI